MATFQYFLWPVRRISFHILFAVVLFQNELITAVLECPTVWNDREPHIICNGLSCLFILDPTIYRWIPPKNWGVLLNVSWQVSNKAK